MGDPAARTLVNPRLPTPGLVYRPGLHPNTFTSMTGSAITYPGFPPSGVLRPWCSWRTRTPRTNRWFLREFSPKKLKCTAILSR